jgi:hypothetical protein
MIIIDLNNLELLDKIFTMISFGIKYLVKPIKQDLPHFYNVYFEVLTSKSKHLRKFAA